MKKLLNSLMALLILSVFATTTFNLRTEAIGDMVQITSGSGSFPVELNDEGATSQSITIHLDTAAYGMPTDEVVVTCTIDNPSQITIDDPGAYYFNSKNSFGDQTITISAVDDSDQESTPHIVNVDCGFVSPDPVWNSCIGKVCSNVLYSINIADNDMDTDGDTIPDISDYDDDGDNVSDITEDSGPNSGDGNNDSRLDSLQMDVTTTLNSQTGSYQTLDISGNCKENQVLRYDVTFESDNSTQDNARDYSLGMNNFSIKCSGKSFGSTMVIDFYYDKVYDTSLWEYVKYDTLTNSYVVMDASAYEYLTINNGTKDVTVVRTTLTDGGIYDMDGVANGEIVDPSGPSVLASVTPIEATT